MLARAPQTVVSLVVLFSSVSDADVIRLVLIMGRWWYDTVLEDQSVWSAMWDRRVPRGMPRHGLVSYQQLRTRVSKQVALRPLQAHILSPIVGCTRSCAECPLFAEVLVEIERPIPRWEYPRLLCTTCNRRVRTFDGGHAATSAAVQSNRLYAVVNRRVLRKRHPKETYGMLVVGYPDVEAANRFLRELMLEPTASLTFKPSARVSDVKGSCAHQYEFFAEGVNDSTSTSRHIYETVHVGDVPEATWISMGRKRLVNPSARDFLDDLEQGFGSESDSGSTDTPYDPDDDRED